MTINGKKELFIIGMENGVRIDKFNKETLNFEVVGELKRSRKFYSIAY